MTSLTVDIRPATGRDAEQIADVHGASWRNAYEGLIPHKSLQEMISRRNAGWWKRAISGGMVAGYCTYGLNRARALPQEGEIYELYIRPEYQGIGLGTILFDAAQASLKNHGCDGLVVWALEDNNMAMRFYAGHGGRDVAQGFETFENKPLRKVAFVWA